MGFGVCNSISVTILKGKRLPFPLPLLVALPLPANRCRFLHIKAVDLPESFLHASNALCFRGLYLSPLIKLLNAALHMAHHQRRVCSCWDLEMEARKASRGIGLGLHATRQAKKEIRQRAYRQACGANNKEGLDCVNKANSQAENGGQRPRCLANVTESTVRVDVYTWWTYFPNIHKLCQSNLKTQGLLDCALMPTINK